MPSNTKTMKASSSSNVVAAAQRTYASLLTAFVRKNVPAYEERTTRNLEVAGGTQRAAPQKYTANPAPHAGLRHRPMRTSAEVDRICRAYDETFRHHRARGSRQPAPAPPPAPPPRLRTMHALVLEGDAALRATDADLLALGDGESFVVFRMPDYAQPAETCRPPALEVSPLARLMPDGSYLEPGDEPGSEDEDGDCESDDARTIHAGDSDSECESEDAASGVLLEDLVVEWMSWIHSFAGRK